MNEESAKVPDAQGAPITLRKWQAEAFPLVVEAVKARKQPVISAFMGSGKSLLCAYVLQQSRTIEGRSAVIAAPSVDLVNQLAATFRKVLGDEAVGRWFGSSKQWDRRVVVTTYQSLPTLVERWKVAGRRASLLVCDECHKTGAETWKAGIEALEALNRGADGRGHLARIGLTATPFRTSPKETLDLWSEIIYRYTSADGIRDGVIVPWRVERWGGEGRGKEDVDGICLDMIRSKGVFPVLANAADIEDAEAFAAYLTAAGVEARAVHSELSDAVIGERKAALKAGYLKVLVHVNMLAEGSDFPWLRTLLLRRRVQARVRFVQEVGRVLRVDPDNAEKTEGIILDPLDLMGLVGISHPEQIGAVLDGEEPERTDGAGRKPAERGEGEGLQGLVVIPLDEWLDSVCAAMEPFGFRETTGWRGWTERRASQRQIELLSEKRTFRLWQWVPEEYKPAVDRIKAWIKSGRISQITQRQAADLVGVLYCIGGLTKDIRNEMRIAFERGGTKDAGRIFATARAKWKWPAGCVWPSEVPGLDEAP